MGHMDTTQRNGIDTELMSGTIEAIRQDPGLGAVTIRTRHRWDDGFGVDGAAEWVEHAGVRKERRHRFRGDWPEPYGRDTGPAPGEGILAALGASIAATYAAKAADAGVSIDELEVAVTGRMDLRGFFELGGARPGLSEVAVEVIVHSSADDAVLEELGRTAARTSGAYDAVTNPVPGELTVRRRR